jgi:hypothetical protein
MSLLLLVMLVLLLDLLLLLHLLVLLVVKVRTPVHLFTVLDPAEAASVTLIS